MILNSDFKDNNGTLMTKFLYLSKIKLDFFDARIKCNDLDMSLVTFGNEDQYEKLMKSINSAEPRIENAYTAYRCEEYNKWFNSLTSEEVQFKLIFHEHTSFNYQSALTIEYANDEYKFSTSQAFTDHSYICESIEPSLNSNSYSTIIIIIVILLSLCVIFIFAYKKYIKKIATSVTPAVVEEQP